MADITILSPFISDSNTQKLVTAAIIGAGLVAVSARATANIRRSDGAQQALVPSKKLSTFGFLDFLVERYVDLHDSVLGPEKRKYVGFSGSLFLFILACNLLGLVPGMPAATTTVWLNVGLAISVFVYFNWQGVKENGFLGYLKHFCGPLPILAILIFPLEVLSTCLRLLTLNLRLYWNISADHMVLGIFTEMTPWVVPVVFLALGTFISFMQAFVFAMLTMLYILLATQHEDDSH